MGVVRFLCRIDRLDRIVVDGFFLVLNWEFATAFAGHEAWAILNAQPGVALYRAALYDVGPWRI